MPNDIRIGRNRTTALSAEEKQIYRSRLHSLSAPLAADALENSTICQDIDSVLPLLPDGFVDLLFVDPPYNLPKSFNGRVFQQKGLEEYAEWLDSLMGQFIRLLKPSASIYVCGDWRSSAAIHYVLERYFFVRNRITWERDKGRGAMMNWKNCCEDIWFCTVSEQYVFNIEAVKLRRKVIAPYRNSDGKPKGWEETEAGDFRLTYPSNIWTDVTVPFWSMPENTEHPTQKPEKLLAKILLASTLPGQLVFDPFLGSGTTLVVAKKLGRRYVGVEIDETYCCLAEKRLDMAGQDRSIQGYSQGVFWERNTLAEQRSGGQDSLRCTVEKEQKEYIEKV